MLSEKDILRVNSQGFGTHKTLDHDSADALTEYKILIIDPVAISYLMNRAPGYTEVKIAMGKGEYQLKVMHDPTICLADLEARREQVAKFLAQGKVIICFLEPLFIVQCYIGYDQVGSLFNYDWLQKDVGQRNLFKLKRNIRGQKIVLTDEGRKNNFRTYLGVPEISWKTSVEGFETGIKPVVLAKNSQGDPVSFVINYAGGRVIFLPHSSAADMDKVLIECITAEYESVTHEVTPSADWTKLYVVPGMQSIESNLKEQREKISLLEKQENELQQELDRLNFIRDTLLNRKGEILNETVIDVLNEMGIKATLGPEGRDDILIFVGEEIKAVCETKGTKGSASEADATQLSKWVDRVYEEKGYEPKGILIVNAFCEINPSERKEPAFPKQMLPYCQKRNYCLITTIQLFNIYCDFKKGIQKDGDSLLDEWIKCNGVYPKYQDITGKKAKI